MFAKSIQEVYISKQVVNMAGIIFLGLIYLTFISLGLPDSLLGAVWPVMRLDFGTSVDAAGLIFFIISAGTIFSSLISGRVISRFGTGKVAAVSVLLTASALIGGSFVPSAGWFALIAVPLGLGGGGVDAGLNNYVALNYAPRHMSWLHCFWGVGAFMGPFIISGYLRHGENWRGVCLALGSVQFFICLLLFLSLSLWKKRDTNRFSPHIPQEKDIPFSNTFQHNETAPEDSEKAGALRIPGVIPALITFFIYCAAEYTLGLWGASFLTEIKGFSSAGAAQAVSLYFIGITAGRFANGFLTLWCAGGQLIRMGICIIITGAVLLALPLPRFAVMPALFLVGLGCAPIYPSMIHLTPERFGPQNSARVISLQMAYAYCGSTFIPPLAGIIAARTTMAIIPFFLIGYGIVMLFMSEKIRRAIKQPY
jgi:fucose permease